MTTALIAEGYEYGFFRTANAIELRRLSDDRVVNVFAGQEAHDLQRSMAIADGSSNTRPPLAHLVDVVGRSIAA